MSILYLLIPLSLSLLGLAVWAFFWAVKHDQFDDLEGPAYRILFDEDDLPPEARKRRQRPDSDNAEDAQDNPGIDTGTDNASTENPNPENTRTDSTRMDRDT